MTWKTHLRKVALSACGWMMVACAGAQAATTETAEAFRLRAATEYQQRQGAQAIETCEQGLALYPASRGLAELYVLLVHQEFAPSEQQTRLQAMSARIPGSPTLSKAYAEVLLSADPENTQAFTLLAGAAKELTQDPQVHFYYGEAACFNKQEALCIRELSRAHALSPGNGYANMQLYTMIAVAEDRLKEPLRAQQAFASAMNANEHLPTPSPYAALKYVTFLTAQGNAKKAEPVLDEMLRWDPAYGPAHFERAKILAQKNAQEDAAQEAERALADSRATPTEQRTYHAFLAKTYFALGQESKARTHQDWVEANQAASP